MKEKNILKVIKKVIISSTPRHLSLVEKNIVPKRKPRFWQALPIATLAASAVVIGIVSSIATPSEVNNSSVNVQRPISEMMAQLTNPSYTLSYVVDNVIYYAYEVAEPLIKITIPDTNTGTTHTTYFMDVSDANSPYFYQIFEEETWSMYAMEPYEALGFTSPLSLIDPFAIEDAWFVWNESIKGYQLNSEYLSQVFENSPLQGVEDVEIWMTVEGNIVLSFGGRIHQEHDQHAILQLIYSDFGTTTVTLPTNVIDLSMVGINDLLNGSTNHRYAFYFTPVNEESNALPFVYQTAERDGETFKKNEYRYDYSDPSSGGVVIDTYVTKNNDQFIQIVSDASGYFESPLDQEAYDLALENFYPVNILELQESWLDIENEVFLETFGTNAYPILANYLDGFLNLQIEGSVEDFLAYAAMSQSYWQGATITVFATLTIDNIPYQFVLELYSFNQVQGIYLPYAPSVRTTLSESLALAVGTSSYMVEQFTMDAEGNYVPSNDSYVLVRSNEDFQRYRFNAQGYLDVDYFGKLGDEYFTYKYVYNQGEYVKETIDQNTYEASVIDIEWLRLANIQSEDYQENNDMPGEYILSPSSFERIFSQAILAEVEITEALIRYMDVSYGNPVIVFSFAGTDRLTGSPVQFESRYSYFGQATIYFPNSIEDGTNPTDPTSGLQLSIEAFNERYPNGVESFIGTLYGFDDTGEIIIYEVFSLQNNEALIINREDGTYTQILSENGQYIQIQGSLNTNETTTTSSDQATFAALSSSLSFINFDAFNSSHLTPVNEDTQDGLYQVNLDQFDELFNLPIDPSIVITEAYVEIRSDLLLVYVNGWNEETGQYVTYYLVLEALNQDVYLIDYLE